jgi:purine nucleosidase
VTIAATSDGPPDPVTHRIPLLLDVDTGIDDALALLYAAASPEAELVAVTTLSGNAEAADVARNTLAILELAGRGDVEVAVGRRVPLLRPLEITPETHGPTGIGYAVLPDPASVLSDRYAPQLIVDEARRRPGELTLVTLGPLTNLAVAVLIEPELPRLLHRWILMGGAFRVPGNTTPTTEWNVHCDPEAARICLAAWGDAIARDPSVPRALAMGLDVTERARILPADVAALAARAGVDAGEPGVLALDGGAAGGGGAAPSGDAAARGGAAFEASRRATAGNPIVRYVADSLRYYFEFHARYDGFYGAFIHDPLVVACALDPSLVRSEPATVVVDTSGGAADGQTIADWRHLLGRAPNADVAVEADAGEFLRRLVERVGGLAARRGGA